MENKFIAAVIAIISAVVIYLGGWEIIKFFGSKVFSYPWNSTAILSLSAMTLALLFCTVAISYKIYYKVLERLPL